MEKSLINLMNFNCNITHIIKTKLVNKIKKYFIPDLNAN